MGLNMETVLVCTVGGSHEPIVTAIESLSPDRVCFVCSRDDGATGAKGSYLQITGKGNVLTARRQDDKPSLPNIPTLIGLSEDRFEVLLVAPDDFDDARQRIAEWLATQHGEALRLVADYTGGTKTMSAALVCAALDDGRVALQLVTGARADLTRVESGSQQALPARVFGTRFRRDLDRALSMWKNHAYEQAVLLLEDITPPMEGMQSSIYQRARDLSRAFTLWDRFDHQGAYAVLSRYRPVVGRRWAPLLRVLDLLVKEVPAREPLRLFDLFRNAERRAAQGRYDDAVARLYRMLEWSAQWLLRERAGIDTSDVPETCIPPGLVLPENRRGRRQAGLHAAWQLAAAHAGETVARFWALHQAQVLDLLTRRNHSILAHGFTPLTEADWRSFYDWTHDHLVPLLLESSGGEPYRVRTLPDQLPTRMPE